LQILKLSDPRIWIFVHAVVSVDLQRRKTCSADPASSREFVRAYFKVSCCGWLKICEQRHGEGYEEVDTRRNHGLISKEKPVRRSQLLKVLDSSSVNLQGRVHILFRSTPSSKLSRSRPQILLYRLPGTIPNEIASDTPCSSRRVHDPDTVESTEHYQNRA